jgi:hypothetical protein
MSRESDPWSRAVGSRTDPRALLENRGESWGAPAAGLLRRVIGRRGAPEGGAAGDPVYRLRPHRYLPQLRELVAEGGGDGAPASAVTVDAPEAPAAPGAPAATAAPDAAPAEAPAEAPRDASDEVTDPAPTAADDDALIVGTVRMGYGHYRFALSLVDAAQAQGRRPCWLDLGRLRDPASDVLRQVNKLYSGLSRVAADRGGVLDYLWEQLTSSGDWNALRLSVELAPQFTSLLGSLDRRLPYLSTFAWTGHIAVAAGFERVVHLVHDNAPMPFVVVPGALNLVQSPSMYAELRRLGIPAEDLEIAGHWVPQTMARSAEQHSELRRQRIERGAPRRLLIPIGGAGSQVGHVSRILSHLGPRLRDGQVSVLLNCGDHRIACQTLVGLLEDWGLPHRVVRSWREAFARAEALQLSAPRPADPSGVEVFAFDHAFPGVRLTDRLITASDVLVTKPSELAFVPVPKLLLHRVGNHEGPGAVRAAELGDGTPECRSWRQTRFYLDELTQRDELLSRLAEGVTRNARAGVYDGSIRAVEIASHRAGS